MNKAPGIRINEYTVCGTSIQTELNESDYLFMPTTIGVVTRPGARICPGGPEHLPGLTRTFYPDFTLEGYTFKIMFHFGTDKFNESTIVFGIDTKQFLLKILLK